MRFIDAYRQRGICPSRLSVATRFIGAAIILLCAISARADLTQAYSFETDLQGFGPNGGGITITLDTIGATHGTQSMKVSIVDVATFIGALTANVAPEIGDPPGMDAVEVDLTLTEQFPAEGFIDAGITIFGASQPDFPGGQLFGQQAQFQLDQIPLGDLAVGTHTLRFELTEATHPLTFELKTFNDIFGTEGSGPNDLIPTGFQIYFNKSGNIPWTGYIDNIRVGTQPPPVDADFNDDTFVDGDDLTIWKGAFGASNPAGDADGDTDSDGADFLIWQRQLGPDAVATIPEPSAIALAALSVAMLFRRRQIIA